MKRILNFTVVAIVALSIFSCKQNVGENAKNETCVKAENSAVAVAEATYEICASTQDSVALLPPSDLNGVTISDALKNRRTIREFSDKNLSDQQISDLLWCACGANREDGKRTAPTARNAQEMDVYLFTPAAIYYYQAASHSLKLVKVGDFRDKAGKQGAFIVAPVSVSIVADFNKMDGFDDEAKQFYSATDAGFISQNIYLYASASGLATVTCGNIDRPGIVELLGLPNAKAILSHPVGYEAEAE